MRRDKMEARLAQLLEDCGVSAEEAARKAARSVDALRTAAPGTTYGHLHPSDLAGVWKAAARAGRRRLVLEIVNEAGDLDEDEGRISAKVIDVENWPTWTDEHAVQRAATDELLTALSPALPKRIHTDIGARTAAAIFTDEQRQEALEAITAQRAELLEELATLDAVDAGHREALERGTARLSPLDLAHRAAHPELYDDGEVTQLAPGVFLVPAELSELELMARGLDLPPSWLDTVDELEAEGAQSPEEWEAKARARAGKLN